MLLVGALSRALRAGLAYITVSNSPKSMNLICWVQLMARYLILALACKLELKPLLYPLPLVTRMPLPLPPAGKTPAFAFFAPVST